MGIEAKIIADSIGKNGVRFTTLQVKFHRFILPEVNTHRVFSRNYSSSRAIPTHKILEQIKNDPAMPVFWGRNQAGMQAKEELQGADRKTVISGWKIAAEEASFLAAQMSNLGVHKQIVNRIIEPFTWSNGIISATDWDNFFEQRIHPDAQPEIQALAIAMKDAMDISEPKYLEEGEWHLPYIRNNELHLDIELLKKISAARCCRVSYNKHDGSNPSVEEDLVLFDKLAGSVPMHCSPLEHQATPDYAFCNSHLYGNLRQWIQFRKEWEFNKALS